MNDPGSVHSLTAENILAAFPIALQEDQDMAALGEVTARLLARRPEEIDRLCIYPEIHRLDEKLLDILAYDYKVDWWDPDYGLEEKRRTLADSWRVHKILGTRSAVETALRAVYPKADVQEWFEYGGKPYYFKLSIDLTGEISDAARPWRVLEKVNFYKSLRSHVKALIFTFTMPPATLHVGGGVGTVVSMGVPAGEDTYDFRHTLPVGGSFGADTSIGVPTGTDTYDFRNKLHIGGNVGADTSVGVPAGTDIYDFRSTLPVGGSFGADADIGIPAGADTFDFRDRLPVGGTGGIQASAGIPAGRDKLEFSQTLRAGGKLSGCASLPVPEGTAQPPPPTILRAGGVFTIISNRTEVE